MVQSILHSTMQEPGSSPRSGSNLMLLFLLAGTGMAALLGAAIALPFALPLAMLGGFELLVGLGLLLGYVSAAWYSAFQLYRDRSTVPPFAVVCSLTCLGAGLIFWYAPIAIAGSAMAVFSARMAINSI